MRCWNNFTVLGLNIRDVFCWIDVERDIFEFPNEKQIVVRATVSIKLELLVSIRFLIRSRHLHFLEFLLNCLLKQPHNLFLSLIIESDLYTSIFQSFPEWRPLIHHSGSILRFLLMSIILASLSTRSRLHSFWCRNRSFCFTPVKGRSRLVKWLLLLLWVLQMLVLCWLNSRRWGHHVCWISHLHRLSWLIHSHLGVWRQLIEVLRHFKVVLRLSVRLWILIHHHTANLWLILVGNWAHIHWVWVEGVLISH